MGSLVGYVLPLGRKRVSWSHLSSNPIVIGEDRTPMVSRARYQLKRAHIAPAMLLWMKFVIRHPRQSLTHIFGDGVRKVAADQCRVTSGDYYPHLPRRRKRKYSTCVGSLEIHATVCTHGGIFAVANNLEKASTPDGILCVWQPRSLQLPMRIIRLARLMFAERQELSHQEVFHLRQVAVFTEL